MSDATIEERVQEAIELIRPAIQGHGGDIEFVSIDEDNVVKVRLQGACHGCPAATMTLKMGVQRMVQQKVPEIREVVALDM